MKSALSLKTKRSLVLGLTVFFLVLWMATVTGGVIIRAVAESMIWNGTTAYSYAGGDGSAENPYQIANGAQLAKLVQETDTTGKYYVLTADILLNDVRTDEWKENNPRIWFGKWNSDGAFRGCLDGQGYTVSGIYIPYEPDPSNGGRSGLFAVIGSGAVIRSVRVAESYISAGQYSGAIAGFSEGIYGSIQPQISNCSVDKTVELNGRSVGGILGGGPLTANVDDCCFAGKLLATGDTVNGIVGDFWSVDWSLTNSYTVGYTAYRNGYQPSECSHVYSTVQQNGVTTLTLEQMTGTSAKVNMAGLDWENTWLVKANRRPVQRVFQARTVWDGTAADSYASGDGSEGNPYQIANGAQLAKLVQDSDTAGKYYELTADILLNDTADTGWETRSPHCWFFCTTDTLTFRGHLEGNGCTVGGLYLEQTPASQTTYSFTGMFPVLGSGAVVRNVGIVDAHLASQGYVGAVAGYSFKTVGATRPQISGCYADESVNLCGETAGGILGGGSLTANFDNCYFIGTLSASTPGLGNGIVGDFWSTDWEMSACYAVGYPLYRETYTPAICRYAYSTVEQYGITTLTRTQMTGEAAKTNMKGFDWNQAWRTAEGTPVLQTLSADYTVDCRPYGNEETLKNYRLVWGDEFTSDELDSSKWRLGENMAGNTELLLVRDNPQILRVEDSQLRLAARSWNDPAHPAVKYAATYSVRTKETMSFRYGYLEMRARVPYSKGAWPSFWLLSGGALGANPNDAYRVEVDIFEVFSSRDTATPNIHKWVTAPDGELIHHSQYAVDRAADNCSYRFSNSASLSQEYHYYGFQWTPQEMRMFIDGQEYMRYDLNDNYDGYADMQPFHSPLYIVLNNHVFTESGWRLLDSWLVTDEDVPAEYDVDWIRLYQDVNDPLEKIYLANESTVTERTD